MMDGSSSFFLQAEVVVVPSHWLAIKEVRKFVDTRYTVHAVRLIRCANPQRSTLNLYPRSNSDLDLCLTFMKSGKWPFFFIDFLWISFHGLSCTFRFVWLLLPLYRNLWYFLLSQLHTIIGISLSSRMSRRFRFPLFCSPRTNMCINIYFTSWASCWISSHP